MSEILPEQPLDNPGKPRRTRRRWFQFGLGTLLVLVTLCGVLLAAWRAYLAPYRAQRETMALIERLKGSYQTQEAPSWANRLSLAPADNITFVNLADCDKPAEYVDAVSRLPRLETLVVGGLAFGDEHLARLRKLSALRWLVLDSTSVTADGLESLRHALPDLHVYQSDRRIMWALRARGADVWVGSQRPDTSPELPQLVGAEFLDAWGLFLRGTDVTDASLAYLAGRKGLTDFGLYETKVTDAGLAHLAGLENLMSLDVSETAVTDEGLVHLARLRNLKKLSLEQTKITGVGLNHLAALRNLESLSLDDTAITDAGLAHLATLKNLQTLKLRNTKVTDAGLAHVAALENLETLRLSKTAVTDLGLAYLATLKNLKSLELGDTNVTGAGLKHLAALMNLEYLFLNHTRLTDASLVHVACLKKLVGLDLLNTVVTDAGVAQLRRALPNCQIVW